MRNYLSEMLYALTSAYSRKDYDNRQQELPLETNIGKLFSILAWGLDSVEEQAELIRLWDDIDNARGAVLDRYGANFGVKRVSSDDRFYRLAIKVKFIAQLSGGDTDTVIRATGDLLEVDLSEVDFEDVFPAKIALYVDQNLIAKDRLELIEPIAQAIKRILAAGVGMRLYMRTYRTYRLDVTFLECGFGATATWSDPVSKDRTGLHSIAISNASFAQASFAPPPFTKDRKGRNVWDLSNAGFLESNYALVPYTEDKVSTQTVDFSIGAVQTPKVYSPPPDTKRALRGQHRGAGGAIYHAHIKSKRID